MRMTRPAFAAVVAASLATGLLSGAARAETVTFHAMLNGASEVPPNDSKGTGTLEASLDTATKTLTYTLSYSGLTGTAIAAHFHGPAMAGHNAGVAVPIKDLKSGDSGKATLTAAQIADLEAGKWYVNVHTKAHSGGEIRGQVEKAM